MDNLEGGLVAIKARMLCEGVNVDDDTLELFRAQNPSNTKRGGLSSGGKFIIEDLMPVNAPYYLKRQTAIRLVKDPAREFGILIIQNNQLLAKAEALIAPNWYKEEIGLYKITEIITAHNKQLATAVYEGCSLFATGEQCKFCAIDRSLQRKCPELIVKPPQLIIAALEKIPMQYYGGLSLNGGMTFGPGRGMEIIEEVALAVSSRFPDLPIAAEITPPEDLSFIKRLAKAGVQSLMMNLECWDESVRNRLIPGKNKYCPKPAYLAAFAESLKVLGNGKVSTCFVAGIEPWESLKEGIAAAVKLGVVPSPLSGRFFEDIPDYPFSPSPDWRKFLEILYFARQQMKKYGLESADKAGCVACGMCDAVKDVF